MKNCLNNKCAGEIKLLYDYGNNSDLAELNVDCTQPTKKFLKPKIELETLQIELEIKKMELTVVRNEIQRLRKQSNKPLRVIK